MSGFASRVKKFKDRIFSASRKEDSYSGTDYSEGPESPGPGHGASPRKFSSMKSKNSSLSERTGPELVGTSSMRSNASAAHGPIAVTLKESPILMDHNASPSGGSVLPPVQISSNQNSFTSKGQQPPNLAALYNSTGGTSGRRKSTPAALDMALRTAEGKAAVEQLLQPGQNKLVFGNYFAGTHAAARDQAAAHVAAEKQRAKVAHPGVATSQSPLKPSPIGPPMQAFRPPVLPSIPAVAVDAMATVPEDVAMEDAMPPHAATASTSRKHGADNMPSMQSPSALGASGAHKMLHSSQPQVPVSVPLAHPPQPLSSPQLPTATPRPPLQPPVEEPTTSNRPAGKLISISSQLPAAMQRKNWSLADYNIIRKMYTGYASTVYQAMCKKSLEMVALKVYHMQNLCELNHYQVFREIRVHASLQHQNIIHLFAAFQEATDVVLVQEYAEGGDLYRLLHKNGGRLSERQAVEMVLHPFLLALHYLHMRGIMHRDIKPENVLFTEHRVLKLADFGLAIDLTEERAVTRAGTLDYMAPEVLRCPPKNLPQENKNNPYLHYNNSVDAWAVGVFAYELIVGFPPFAGETQLDSVDRIMHSVPEFPEKISEFAKDFICQCLRKHPGDRPTVMELLHHPWVRTFQRRTSMRVPTVARRRSSVVYDPHARGFAAAAPSHGNAYTPPQETAEEGLEEPAPMETDVNEMTPEQIEQMIKKLQVAKAQAIAKSESHRSPGESYMHM